MRCTTMSGCQLQHLPPNCAASSYRVEVFDAFREGCRRELAAHPEYWQSLLTRAAAGKLTLLYAACNREHNNARVLQDFLEDELERRGASSSLVRYAGEL